MTTYSIDDEHGQQLTTGIPEEVAISTAQRMADDCGRPVYLYSSDADEDDEAEEIEPRQS